MNNFLAENCYNNAGDLETVSYTDGATPGLSYTYDRRGRLETVTQGGSITMTRAFNDAGQPLSESWSGGPIAGLSVTNGYDQFLRRTNLSTLNASTLLTRSAFSFDTASRLETVTDNSTATPYSATYSYLAKSPLVSQITFKQGATTRMTTSQQHDNLNRLTSISSAIGSSAMGNSYAYNSANQRTRSTKPDGSYWRYEYDSLGQVTNGKKPWSDQTPVAGQQFGYAFDDIGNRTQTKAGGDQNGGGLRPASYSPNSLNQYTSRDVPGAVDIMGVSFATNTVSVNGQPAYRKGEYFWKEVSVSNGSVPVWQSITVAATNQSDVTGQAFVPKTQEQFAYDDDGNLLSDGRWNYTWDAENRLVKLAARTAVGPQISLQFAYDWQGRRIHKQVWDNPTWNGTPTNDVAFLYDGWNLVAILDSQSSILQSFVWGLDLSGSLQGAGGVGGLLFMGDSASAIGYCSAAFDGNGNVIALVSMSGGTNCATYEYGPFGEVIRATGPMAKANPFRFSTKYQDDETDLLYYGYRYYHASPGRWLSHDPLGEVEGGCNLTAFVMNAVPNYVDSEGLDLFPPPGGTQNGDRWDLPYDDFQKCIEEEILRRKLTPWESKFLEAGCIGNCIIMQHQCTKRWSRWPEQTKNTKCFKTQPEAQASKCPNGKDAFVFAKQAEDWKNGQEPIGSPGPPLEPNKEKGEIPLNSMPTPQPGTAFNYISVCRVKQKHSCPTGLIGE